MKVSVPNLKWRDTPIWIRVSWITVCVNSAAFFIIDLLSGGDALNGRIKDGRFYLGDHGHFTEVSQRFFEYSRIHALSVFILTPIAILGCGSYLTRHKDARFQV
jgi:hypothetical protein